MAGTSYTALRSVSAAPYAGVKFHWGSGIISSLKSIGIGILIILAACACFMLAAYLIQYSAIESIALYSAHGPIENIFLVLLTIVIGFVYLLSGLTETRFKVTSEGWFVFFGCLVIFGLFGIPGVVAFTITSKILVAAYGYFTKTKI